MEVQIYYNENKDLIYDGDALADFNKLVDELGLKCNNTKDENKSPIPFTWIDQATVRAFKLLCPNTNSIEEYPLEIPLEVIRQVSLSKTEKYFDKIEVWSNRTDPDPFAVGWVYKNDEDRKKKHSWMMEPYLIGRWGDEALSIPELIAKAKLIATTRIQEFAAVGIAKLESWMKCPEVWAEAYIANNNTEAAKAFDTNGNNALPF